MKIGDKVRRDITKWGKQGIGEIIKIDNVQDRAKVQWKSNKRWYEINRLVVVQEN